jgi:tetratricopeptide (TPR) repeat protein
MVSEATEGVYFERKTMTQGTGHTARDAVDDIHYYVKPQEDGNIGLGIVDFTGKPTGITVETIETEEFFKRFQPCTEHECAFKKRAMDPKKLNAEAKVKQANMHLEKKEFLSAEFEFGNAIKLDEKNVKANYGLGKTFLEQGKTEEAKAVFEKLSNIEALFEKENKHVFNEFGIDLRKNGIYEQAIHNYEKAINIDSEDPALYYNLARVYAVTENYDKAQEALRTSLALDPDFQEAEKYMHKIERLKSGAPAPDGQEE